MLQNKASKGDSTPDRKSHILQIELMNADLRRGGRQDPKFVTMLMKYRQRSLLPHIPDDPKTKILDIACGAGDVLLQLKEMGYSELAGIDISPDNVTLCKEAGLDCVDVHDALALRSYRSDENKTWDLVLCLDIIEHIPQESAVDFLSAIRERVSTNGRVIVQTPNMGYVLSNWVLYADPTHTAGYNERSLTTLLRASGYARIEIFPVWHATTLLGFMREIYVRLLHKLLYLAEGASASTIPSRGIIAIGFKG